MNTLTQADRELIYTWSQEAPDMFMQAIIIEIRRFRGTYKISPKKLIDKIYISRCSERIRSQLEMVIGGWSYIESIKAMGNIKEIVFGGPPPEQFCYLKMFRLEITPKSRTVEIKY